MAALTLSIRSERLAGPDAGAGTSRLDVVDLRPPERPTRRRRQARLWGGRWDRSHLRLSTATRRCLDSSRAVRGGTFYSEQGRRPGCDSTWANWGVGALVQATRAQDRRPSQTAALRKHRSPHSRPARLDSYALGRLHQSQDGFRRTFVLLSAEDAAAIAAQLHEGEAAAARLHKVEHLWEPSPFPFEIA